MPIQSNCPGCGRQLQVGDEYAGRRARCPKCNTIFAVGSSGTEPAEAERTGEADRRWFMKTPEGQVYGPVTTSVLDSWLAEGRISSDCFLRSEGSESWNPADEFYGVLAPIGRPVAASPFAGSLQSPRSSVTPGSATRGRQTEDFKVPHRGMTILALGIAGWLTCCPIFSLMAWMMGASDLREMRSGRMEAGGVGMTQTGHILGVMLSVFWIFLVIGGVFLLVLAVAGSLVNV